MDNNQIRFFGACIILGCSILAIAVGSLAYSTQPRMEGLELAPGIAGAALAVYIGYPVWQKFISEKNDKEKHP